jgi:hypothetical protein
VPWPIGWVLAAFWLGGTLLVLGLVGSAFVSALADHTAQWDCHDRRGQLPRARRLCTTALAPLLSAARYGDLDRAIGQRLRARCVGAARPIADFSWRETYSAQAAFMAAVVPFLASLFRRVARYPVTTEGDPPTRGLAPIGLPSPEWSLGEAVRSHRRELSAILAYGISILGVVCALLITGPDQGWLLWLHACFFGLTWGRPWPRDHSEDCRSLSRSSARDDPRRDYDWQWHRFRYRLTGWIFDLFRELSARLHAVDRRLPLRLHRFLGPAPTLRRGKPLGECGDTGPMPVSANTLLLIESLLDLTHFYRCTTAISAMSKTAAYRSRSGKGRVTATPFVGTTRAVRGYRQPPYLEDYLGYDFVDRYHTHFMLSPAVTLVEMRVWPAARHRDASVEIRPDRSGGQRFMETFPALIAEERWALEKQQQMFNYPSDGYSEVFLRSDSALRRARLIPTWPEREERAARPPGRGISAAEGPDYHLDRSSSGMRRSNSKVVPVRPGNVKGIMDPAPSDVGRLETLSCIVAASRLDIVHHQVEGRCGSGLRRLFRLSHDDMCAAAELEDGEVGVLENRA